MGPIDTWPHDPRPRVYAIYEDGTEIYTTTDYQGYDWQVLTTLYPILSSHEGQSLNRIRIESRYVLNSLWPEVFMYIDAIELANLDPCSTEDYEIISAEFDKDIYQSGVDTGILTIATANNSDAAENFEVRADLMSVASETIVLGPYSFSMEAGEVHITKFLWTVPSEPISTIWHVNVDLYVGGELEDTYFYNQATSSSEMSKAERDSLYQLALDCTEGAACAYQIAAIIPYAGMLFTGAEQTQTHCLVEQYASTDPDKATILRAVEVLDAVELGLEVASIPLHSTVVGGVPVEVAAILVSVVSASIVCSMDDLNAFFDSPPSLLLASQSTPSPFLSALADSMLLAYPILDFDYSNLFYVDGVTEIKILADSLYTTVDSLGINAAYIYSLPDNVVKIVHIGQDPQSFGDIGQNPHDLCRVEFSCQSSDTLEMYIHHKTDLDSVITLHYWPVPVDSVSKLYIELSDTMSIFPLYTDYDGDGTVDYIHYPGGIVTEAEVRSTPKPIHLSSFPNPFNPRTEIKYTISADCHVELAVYDVSGRLVTTLVNQFQRAGDHREYWDGRNANGKEISSGIYFVRLKMGRELLSRKIVLLK